LKIPSNYCITIFGCGPIKAPQRPSVERSGGCVSFVRVLNLFVNTKTSTCTGIVRHERGEHRNRRKQSHRKRILTSREGPVSICNNKKTGPYPMYMRERLFSDVASFIS
jgi:hypothetical protein